MSNVDPKTLFDHGLKLSTAVVNSVDKSCFANSTPCSEWNERRLLNHMLYELSWVPDMVAGRTIAEVGSKYDGDLLGDDHKSNWSAAAGKAMDAIKITDMSSQAHLSYGDQPMDHYINEIATDLIIHSWDAAQGRLCSLWFDPEVCQALYETILPRADEIAQPGVFAPRVPVPDDAPTQVKLLAIYGRATPS